MPEATSHETLIADSVPAIYQTVKTFSMSRQQMEDLYNIEVRHPINSAPLTQTRAVALSSYGLGLLAAFIHIITTEHCEVVCKGADGAIHKGANAAGTGLRWKGTDYLFTPIEVQP